MVDALAVRLEKEIDGLGPAGSFDIDDSLAMGRLTSAIALCHALGELIRTPVLNESGELHSDVERLIREYRFWQ